MQIPTMSALGYAEFAAKLSGLQISKPIAS
jgi:hypothetical protein